MYLLVVGAWFVFIVCVAHGGILVLDVRLNLRFQYTKNNGFLSYFLPCFYAVLASYSTDLTRNSANWLSLRC